MTPDNGDEITGLILYRDEDRWYWRPRWAWLRRVPLVGRRIPSPIVHTWFKVDE